MKTKQRKALEMEAMLLGVKVTYTFLPPRRYKGKPNDRWYSRRTRKYYIRTLPKIAYTVFTDPWESVGAKKFFDLSDIY